MDEEEFQALLRYQAFVSRQVVQEAKTERKIQLLDVYNQLSGYGKKRVQTAALIHELENHGFSEADAYTVMDELIKDGVLSEKDGVLKRT